MDEIQRQITYNTSQIQEFENKKRNLESELLPLRVKLKKAINEEYPGMTPTTEMLKEIFKKYKELGRVQLINKEIVKLNRNINILTITNNKLKNKEKVSARPEKVSARPEKRLEERLKSDSRYDIDEDELEELMEKEALTTKPIDSYEEKDDDDLKGPGITPIADAFTKVSEDEIRGPESTSKEKLEVEKEKINAETAKLAEEKKRDLEIAREDAENAAKMDADQKLRMAAVRKMVLEEKKRERNKTFKKQFQKKNIIRTSEYTRKQNDAAIKSKKTKEEAEALKIAIGKRFRTTLKQTQKQIKPIKINPNTICKAILNSGKNLTKKKYYLPSQFPNLTKLKPIIKTKTETPKK
jgi:hypothetical protein